MEKTMTLLYIISVSAAGAIDTTTVEPIFRDVIFILIMITGVGMALTLDNNRPDVKRKITLAYFFFRLFLGVLFPARYYRLFGIQFCQILVLPFGRFYRRTLAAICPEGFARSSGRTEERCVQPSARFLLWHGAEVRRK
ncbi:hypothetical protein L0B70_00385 [Kaistella sp. 97-N-M2]|uniref:hypothetical protein n=1 Tax=Kaistella sp. 97-N-M2 TaxID=2908645 RepID=UPI001F196E79|nr:hypothetical protein [Kaistella sp. 97-N-M2]UJF29885.1 hypothetical protein L0B70_00385 [Kaistella sp. 97-N-M2]